MVGGRSWIYQEREERVIYPLMTDRQPLIYWASNHLIARIYFDSNTNDEKASMSFRCCRFYIKRNPAKNLTVIDMLTCILSGFFLRENDVTPSNDMKMKTNVTRQIKMMSS